MEGKKFQ